MSEIAEKYRKYLLKYKDFFGPVPLMPIENLALSKHSIKDNPLETRLNYAAQVYYYMDLDVDECFEIVGLEVTHDYMVRFVQEFKKLYGEDCWYREIKKVMYETK